MEQSLNISCAVTLGKALLSVLLNGPCCNTCFISQNHLWLLLKKSVLYSASESGNVIPFVCLLKTKMLERTDKHKVSSELFPFLCVSGMCQIRKEAVCILFRVWVFASTSILTVKVILMKLKVSQGHIACLFSNCPPENLVFCKSNSGWIFVCCFTYLFFNVTLSSSFVSRT